MASPEVEYRSARSLGAVSCTACGLVRWEASPTDARKCARCGAVLHSLSPSSISRSRALLITAIIFYPPAYLLPVTYTTTPLGIEADTIFSGIQFFWSSGSKGLASLVFFASVLIPILKLIVLATLTFLAGRGTERQRKELSVLFRCIKAIGRWSMLDVFVITLTVGVAQFRPVLSISAAAGLLAFALMVAFTMLAVSQFDSRLIWD
ncbi:paraquat-inducible protein A [Caballeronia sp. LjRoot34]|uniref:paraquat-inducible protein A n=1 Tax=Caballeronia sp. LjRoot34 TaxID=3342325 RepID=UPI003ECF6C95